MIIQYQQYLIIMIAQEINKIRFNKLKKERILQIIREGVSIMYYESGYPRGFYFTFEENQLVKLQDMIKQDKYSLEICNTYGIAQIKLLPSQLYVQHKGMNKLCINYENHFPTDKFYNGSSYYIAKYNPTNKIHKSVYSTNGVYYKSHQDVPSRHIVDYIEGHSQHIVNSNEILFPYQVDLNQKQNQAIYKGGINSISFIKGPPGCGKTKIIGRLCRLFLQFHKPVIVGSVSNTGILTIAKQIIEEISCYNNHEKILQIVEHTRLQTQGIQDYLLSQQFTMIFQLKFIYFTTLLSLAEYNKLDPLLQFYSINAYLIRNIALVSRDYISINEITYKLEQFKNKIDVGKKFVCIYMQAFAKTIREAHIIITTTVTAASINERISQDDEFRPFVAILDEASQASFADTFCFLKFNIQKLILAGDQNQLDPTVISNDKLLKETVFSKMCQLNMNYYTMLTIQYRMHPSIAEIPNMLFYNNELRNGVTQIQRASQIEYFKDHPVSFISHNYQEMEFTDQNDLSKKKNYYNLYEIIIIKEKIQLFPKEELKNVGIITPYGVQLNYISSIFHDQIVKYGLTVKTCDGYQGGEKDYIFVSCVRSNQTGKIGFCGQRNRVNVTISRARKGLFIVGNAVTLSAQQNIWQSILYLLQIKNKCFYYDRIITQVEIYEMMQKSNIKHELLTQQKEQKGQNSLFNNYKIISNQKVDKNQVSSVMNKKILTIKVQSILKSLENDVKDPNQKQQQPNKDLIKKIRKTLANNLKKGKKYNENQFYDELILHLDKSFQQIKPIQKRFNEQSCKSLIQIIQKIPEQKEKQINFKQNLVQQLKEFNPLTYQYNHVTESTIINKILQFYLLSKILSY